MAFAYSCCAGLSAPETSATSGATGTAIELKLVNLIRARLKQWRTDGYPGVTATTLELLNPNGWYCFKSNVNVMGSLRIKAACKAHLASAHDGTTVLGSNSDNKSVTVLGSTHVELVGCEQ